MKILCLTLLLSLLGCERGSYREFNRSLDDWRSFKTPDEREKEQKEQLNTFKTRMEEAHSAHEQAMSAQTEQFKNLESQIQSLKEKAAETPKVVIPQYKPPIPPEPLPPIAIPPAPSPPVASPPSNLQKHLFVPDDAPPSEEEEYPRAPIRQPEQPRKPIEPQEPIKWSGRFNVGEARPGGIMDDLPSPIWRGQLIYRQLHCPPCDILERLLHARIDEDKWNPNSFKIVLLPYERPDIWKQKGIEGTPVIVTVENGKETHRIVAFDGSINSLNEILSWSPDVNKKWAEDNKVGPYQYYSSAPYSPATPIWDMAPRCSSPLSPLYPY